MKKTVLFALILGVLFQSCAVVEKCAVTSKFQVDSVNVKVCLECKNLNEVQFKNFEKWGKNYR